MAGFFALGTWLSLMSLRRKPVTGAAGLIGQEGDARAPIGAAEGSAFVAGTHWNATADSDIPAGAKVRVVGVKGMSLKVEEIRNVR